MLQPDELAVRLHALEQETVASGFWDNQKNAQKVMSEMAECKEDLQLMKTWDMHIANAEVGLEIADDDNEVCISSHSSYTSHSISPCESITSGACTPLQPVYRLHA
jgi:hypothetical protein